MVLQASVTLARVADEAFYAVVPAGGAGTRLWPLSRAGHPKFLLDLTGTGRTLLQATIDRLAPLTDSTVIVTGTRHRQAVAGQAPGLELLVEPSPRDSMPAIGLAAAVLARRHPDSDVVIGSFAADHVIADTEAFAAAVAAAESAAREGYVVAIGIEADTPSTAFGYIEMGEQLPGGHAYRVRAFTEKPDAATAADYLATGRYRWNAGMYVMRARVLLAHLDRFQPTMAAGLDEIAAAWDGPEREPTLQRIWPSLTRIAIDHAISEPLAAEGGIAVVPAALGWNDVGDWASLAQVLAAAEGGAHVLGDGELTDVIDSAGAVVVAAGGRQVVVLGAPDAVVVDTPDAVLVTTTAQAQRVKEVVDRLPGRGAGGLL